MNQVGPNVKKNEKEQKLWASRVLIPWAASSIFDKIRRERDKRVDNDRCAEAEWTGNFTHAQSVCHNLAITIAVKAEQSVGFLWVDAHLCKIDGKRPCGLVHLITSADRGAVHYATGVGLPFARIGAEWKWGVVVGLAISSCCCSSSSCTRGDSYRLGRAGRVYSHL